MLSLEGHSLKELHKMEGGSYNAILYRKRKGYYVAIELPRDKKKRRKNQKPRKLVYLDRETSKKILSFINS